MEQCIAELVQFFIIIFKAQKPVKKSMHSPYFPSPKRTLFASLIAGFCLLPAMIGTSASFAQSMQTSQNLPSLGDTERQNLSPLMERKLGEEVMVGLRHDRDYLDDAPLAEYLNNFGNSLVAASPEARGEASFNYYFFAVRDPMLNAFALPGGFIGVHSGLVLAAQTEAELAAVLSHEIGHVGQRHIARMMGQQRQDAFLPLAGILLAILASRSSTNASMGVLMGSQSMALQRQLQFSRDAEREADRIGFQILGAAGFDTSGMVAFFGRLETATRSYTDATPSYLRSHPLTTERIADIQARIREQPYHQRADSLDFYLMRARARVLQDESAKGLHQATAAFTAQLQQKGRGQTAGAHYGLAFIAMKQGASAKATSLLAEARKAAGLQANSADAAFAYLSNEILLSSKQSAEAVKQANLAHAQFPHSRGLAWQLADALIAQGQTEEAATYLRDQIQLYRGEAQLQERLAAVYSTQNKQALQHMALAESYALGGNYAAALQQLAIARRAPDASFYDHSTIDSRERDLRARRLDEMQETRK